MVGRIMFQSPKVSASITKDDLEVEETEIFDMMNVQMNTSKKKTAEIYWLKVSDKKDVKYVQTSQ